MPPPEQQSATTEQPPEPEPKQHLLEVHVMLEFVEQHCELEEQPPFWVAMQHLFEEQDILPAAVPQQQSFTPLVHELEPRARQQ